MIRLAVLALSGAIGPASAQVVEPAAQAAQTAKSAADAIILTGPVGALFILVVIGLVLACVVLGFVIRALWNTIAGRDAIIAGLQDKRAEDAGKSSKLLAEVATIGTAALAANTTSQAELTNRMQAFADLVRPLGPDNGRILGALDRNAEKIDECTTALVRLRGAA